MTGYKTDSCSESSDDEGDLPRGILSDSERHNRVLRKKFSKTRSHLSREQRQQIMEDIKQGAFLKPEETFANTELERQSKQRGDMNFYFVLCIKPCEEIKREIAAY